MARMTQREVSPGPSLDDGHLDESLLMEVRPRDAASTSQPPNQELLLPGNELTSLQNAEARNDQNDASQQGLNPQSTVPDTRRRRFLQLFKNPADYTAYDMPTKNRKLLQSDNTAREYRRRTQQRRILLNSTSRLAVTTVLCAMCALVLYGYQKRGLLTPGDIQWLNTLMTALPLVIGLNYRSSLQGYVKVLRWWILARWAWSLRQFDLILDAASTQAILKLMWYSTRRARSWLPSGTHIACAIWVLTNIAGAVGIALVSLAYNLDQSEHVLLRSGLVNTLDVNNETIFTHFSQDYGLLSSPITTLSLQASDDERMDANRTEFNGLRNVDRPETELGCESCSTWEYNFQDKNPSIKTLNASTYSIMATADCTRYTIVEWTATNFTYDYQSKNRTIALGKIQSTGLIHETFYFHENETMEETCEGSQRCSAILAYLTPKFLISGDVQASEKDPSLAFLCSNTISEIKSKSIDAPPRELSDASARALAGAIAVAPLNKTVERKNLFNPHEPWSLTWNRELLNNLPNMTTSDQERFVASTLAQFSLTSLAAADQDSEWLQRLGLPHGDEVRVDVLGQQPYRAFVLNVRWKYAIAILCTVPVLQLLILLAIVFFASDIVVKDDSHLCIARLLEPITQSLGDRGCLLTVEEVIDALGDDELKFSYGCDRKEGAMRVTIFEQQENNILTKKAYRTFPEGIYD